MAKLGGCCGNTTSVHDSVCQDFVLTGGEEDPGTVDVWENTSPYVINGTILVENATASTGDVSLIINNNPNPPVVTPGNSLSVTASNINSISLSVPANESANVKVSYSLNYSF